MFSKNSYIPPYIKQDLTWFERDGLMTYIDQLQYKRFEEDRDNYLKNVKVINFDIINHELKGSPLEKNILDYKTIYTNDLKQMPADDKDVALAACFRSKRKDLYVEKNLRNEYFRTWNSSSTSSSNSSSSNSSSGTCKKKLVKIKKRSRKKIRSISIVGKKWIRN